MDGGEQFKTKRRLKPGDEFSHPVKTPAGEGGTVKDRPCLLNGAGGKSQGLAWLVHPIAVAQEEMPFYRVEDMAQVLRIRSIGCFLEGQLEGFARNLQEVHELVDLQQRDERVQQTAQVAVHQAHQRRPAWGHLRNDRATDRLLRIRRGPGFEDNHVQAVQAAQCLRNAGAYNVPVQAAEATAKGWHGHGANATGPNHMDQILQPRFNGLNPAVSPPVALGGKVDDGAGMGEGAGLEDKHGAEPHLTPLASLGVGAEILRKRPLELEGNAAPHHTDAIHCVDKGFGVFGQDVPCGEAKHWWPLLSQLIVPVLLELDSGPVSGCLEGLMDLVLRLWGAHADALDQ